jgi:4-amino-4-deoxy-L-arabinose transferase-like glycosyltransferase
VVKNSPLSRSSPFLLPLGFFCALAVAWTWPLLPYLSSRIPHDPGDPVLNTYLLWWNAATVPFAARWWDPPFFFPMRGALALSEHLAGVGVISTPVQLLGGSPVLAYNVALLASCALSAWFTFLLVRRLTGSPIAAVCAGVAYGFAPFRAGQLAHLQVLTSQWLPLQLLAMHAYLDDGRRRWLVLAGAAWLIQGLSNGYYLLFTPVLVALWLAWFPRRLRDRKGLSLAGAWALASLPFIPLLLKYREVHGALGLTRGESEIVGFSARPASFLNPPHMLAFWPPRNVPAAEDFLFPGVTVVILICAGALAGLLSGRWRSAVQRRSPFVFYTLAAIVMAVLTFGPGDPGAGASRWIRPYYWLTLLPGFDALRVPARFAMLSTLCAAVAAGLALARLPAGRLPRIAHVTLAAAGLFVDGWIEPMPLLAPPGRQLLDDVPRDAAILEVPPHETLISINAMYRALFHRRPLINGYSGHIPPHYSILSQALQRGDPSVIVELARGRPLVLIVNERYDPRHEYRSLIEALPGVTNAGSGSAGAMYLHPAQPRERIAGTGTPLAATTTLLPREHVVFDLGAPRTVRTIELPLQWHYPELGSRLAIETSLDGATWTMAWLDWTGGRALAGALEDPRIVPFRVPLPDVTARYLRIHPAPDWMVRALRVLGP